ncbi:MAG: hypothetical protein ACK547_02875, partial [Alphaproteobacteria bacterium]
MTLTLERIEAFDIRFPTSRWLAGSDAMNPDPDYSAAYVVIHTSRDDLKGYGFTFSIGREAIGERLLMIDANQVW